MKSERWKKVDEIFESALELRAEERASFIAEACAGDEELRREVESLIANDLEDDFLESPASEEAARAIALDGESLKTGEEVGRYKVLERIGEGGMGEVFLAEDESLKRPVAIKLLSAHFARDAERVSRFRQEALAASALNHPNIITVYEIGRWRERDFIASEFIEGSTLRKRLRGAKLSIVEAVDTALQIAGALAKAHEAGIVHRDVKPENVMMRPDGLVKVLDFGIAKYVETSGVRGSKAALHKTATGAIIGTAAYMSPEQARGSSVDARTDVWSLGVILYEMVARKLPFDGATPSDRMAAVLTREPPPISKLRRNVPPDLERIVNRALEKDASARYADASAMADDLRNLRASLGEAREPRFNPPFSRARFSARTRRRLYIGFAASVLLTAALAAAFIYARRSARAGAIDSLAVLPFASEGGAEAETFSDGITESLINNLSELPDLKVMSRNSVFRFKGSGLEASEAARQLGVRAVLTGRVAQGGERLTVSVELVDASDGAHLWGGRYERRISDLLAMQKEIAGDVSSKLRARLSGEEIRRATRNPTESLEAYQLYLQARRGLNVHTPQSLRESVESFKQAVAVDPDFALAHAGLAHAYGSLANMGAIPPNEAYLKAKQSAEEAVRRDDGLAESHAAVAFVKSFYEWDWDGARESALRAVELNPNSASGYGLLGDNHRINARLEEALAADLKELELDPLNPLSSAHACLDNYYLGRYDEALKHCVRALELDPRFPIAHHLSLLIFDAKGMHAEAVAAFEKSAALNGRDPAMLAALGYSHASSGRRAEASRVLDELKRISEKRHVPAYWFAFVYAGLGEKDQAFLWLDRAFGERFFRLRTIKIDPQFASLRDDARFALLLERMGLRAN